MRLTVLYSDRTIILDGEAYRDEELKRPDPNHRVVQWNDRNSNGFDKEGELLPTGNGWIEVYEGDKIILKSASEVENFVERHAVLKQAHLEKAAAEKAAAEAIEAERIAKEEAAMLEVQKSLDASAASLINNPPVVGE